MTGVEFLQITIYISEPKSIESIFTFPDSFLVAKNKAANIASCSILQILEQIYREYIISSLATH